ncbi:MAG: 16S rRNA (uracil(1498)-N(3))-methyltransferase [Bacteroidota bacterium]
MHLFYEPNILTQPYLNEDDSKHAVKVLRHKVGDLINLVDGKGNWVTAKVVNTNFANLKLDLQSIVNEYNQPNYYIHIAIAPTKNNDRIEWFLEKTVEMGIDEITFIQTQKSERKELKLNRLEKIAVAAMKQSKKAYLPKINPLIKLNDFLKQDLNNFQKFVAFVEQDNNNYLHNLANKKGTYLVLIGPEGDFSNEEIETLKKKDFQCISLGKSILRTETAGITVCNTLNMINLSS